MRVVGVRDQQADGVGQAGAQAPRQGVGRVPEGSGGLQHLAPGLLGDRDATSGALVEDIGHRGPRDTGSFGDIGLRWALGHTGLHVGRGALGEAHDVTRASGDAISVTRATLHE